MNVGLFVLGYFIFMIATYILPYGGSNSVLVQSTSAEMGAPQTAHFQMLLLLHLGSLVVLALLTWARGRGASKGWIAIFPVVAGIFDLTPGLSLIPLIPTVMHVCALIMGARAMPLVQPSASAKAVEQPVAVARHAVSAELPEQALHLTFGEEAVATHAAEEAVLVAPAPRLPPASSLWLTVLGLLALAGAAATLHLFVRNQELALSMRAANAALDSTRAQLLEREERLKEANSQMETWRRVSGQAQTQLQSAQQAANASQQAAEELTTRVAVQNQHCYDQDVYVNDHVIGTVRRESTQWLDFPLGHARVQYCAANTRNCGSEAYWYVSSAFNNTSIGRGADCR